MLAGCKNNERGHRKVSSFRIYTKEKMPPVKAAFYILGKLDGALNLVGTQTSGTSVHMAGSTVDNCLNALDVGLPGTVGTSVGVGDLNTKGNALATIITLRHSLHLPSVK